MEELNLKNELSALKSDLEKNFEQKSKVDIQSAIDAFAIKAKGEYADEVKKIQDAFDQKSEAMH